MAKQAVQNSQWKLQGGTHCYQEHFLQLRETVQVELEVAVQSNNDAFRCKEHSMHLRMPSALSCSSMIKFLDGIMLAAIDLETKAKYMEEKEISRTAFLQ